MDFAETSLQDGNTAAKSKAHLNAQDMAASNVADAGAAAAVVLVITSNIAKKYQNSDRQLWQSAAVLILVLKAPVSQLTQGA